MFRRYASWYGSLSPLVMAVWMFALNGIAMAWGLWEILARDDVVKGVIGLLIWVSLFGAFTAVSFVLLVRYDVPYFRGSLLDYLRGRNDGSGPR